MSKSVWTILQTLGKISGSVTDFAVIILNQPLLCDSGLIKHLWTKGRMRVLVDGGSNRWLDFIEKESESNLKLPDFISGDFDSLQPKTKNYFSSRGVKFVSTPDQDETDFTKALMLIAEEIKSNNSKIDQVFVLCETGGRFDHIMANINTLHRCCDFLPPETSVAILSSQNVTWVLPPGEHVIRAYEDFVQKNYCCGLIPIRGSTVITTSGLKWNLNGDVSEFGKLVSTSNAYSDEVVKIKCDEHVVWTTEYTWQ